MSWRASPARRASRRGCRRSTRSPISSPRQTAQTSVQEGTATSARRVAAGTSRDGGVRAPRSPRAMAASRSSAPPRTRVRERRARDLAAAAAPRRRRTPRSRSRRTRRRRPRPADELEVEGVLVAVVQRPWSVTAAAAPRSSSTRLGDVLASAGRRPAGAARLAEAVVRDEQRVARAQRRRRLASRPRPRPHLVGAVDEPDALVRSSARGARARGRSRSSPRAQGPLLQRARRATRAVPAACVRVRVQPRERPREHLGRQPRAAARDRRRRACRIASASSQIGDARGVAVEQAADRRHARLGVGARAVAGRARRPPARRRDRPGARQQRASPNAAVVKLGSVRDTISYQGARARVVARGLERDGQRQLRRQLAGHLA